MKIITALILFTFINYPIFGQLKNNIIPEENNINLFSEYNNTNDTINKNDNIKDKLFCVDINYVGISLAYAHRIKKSKWFIGGGTGIGSDESFLGIPFYPFLSYIVSIYNRKVEFLPANDMVHLECFVINLPSKHLMLETGVRGSVKMIWNIEDGIELFGAYYVKPMFRWRNFMIGPLIEVLIYYPLTIYFTPLFRFNFKLKT